VQHTERDSLLTIGGSKKEKKINHLKLISFIPKRSARGGDDNKVLRRVYPRKKYGIDTKLYTI